MNDSSDLDQHHLDHSSHDEVPDIDSEDDLVLVPNLPSGEVISGLRTVITEEQQLADRDEVVRWAAQYLPTRDRANGNLIIFNATITSVPKDIRSLLHTQNNIVVHECFGGQYTDIGIKKALINNELRMQIKCRGVTIVQFKIRQLLALY